jgi:hypothetical protein
MGKVPHLSITNYPLPIPKLDLGEKQDDPLF